MNSTHGYPVMILGAGRGGTALLHMFLDHELVRVIGIADANPEAPGLALATAHAIPVYPTLEAAILASRDFPDCILYNLTHDDGVARTVEVLLGHGKVTSGAEAKLFWQIVTRLKQVRDELELSQRQLQAVIHHAMDGIITANAEGIILGFNPAAVKIFGYAPEEVLGRHVKILIPRSLQRKHDEHINRDLNSGPGKITGISGREVVAVTRNGKRFPAEVSVSEMWLGELLYYVGIVRDVTERKAAERRIKHLAHHDYLTDLPNRAFFLERLDQTVQFAARHGEQLAVMFLDLDGFKQVNDRLGHEAGDLLLKEVARRLKGLVRSSDLVARMGGDEFTLLLNSLDGQADAGRVAEKILHAIGAPFRIAGEPCNVGVSIGITLLGTGVKDAGQLLKRADEAMYCAKQEGRNRYRFHAEPVTSVDNAQGTPE